MIEQPPFGEVHSGIPGPDSRSPGKSAATQDKPLGHSELHETMPGDARVVQSRSELLNVLSSGRIGPICGVAALVAFLVLFLDLFVAPDQNLATLYAVVVVVVSFTRRARLVVAAGLACLMILFLAPMAWPPGLQWVNRLPYLVVDGSALLLVTGILLHRLRIEVARDRALADREAALDRVKVLEGLLRTCAWCKRVREHDDQWVPLEVYVARHSQAHFTHGICPDCLAQERGKRAVGR